MNPQNQKQKVVVVVVSGIGCIDKFHGSAFLKTWFKVDVKEALYLNVPLLYPLKASDQNVFKDAMGSNTLWDERLIRKA